MPKRMASPSCVEEDNTFLESIPENSCNNCNELTDQEITVEDKADPLFRSTCHDFQCQKVARKGTTKDKEEVAVAESTSSSGQQLVLKQLKSPFSPVLDYFDINELPIELLDNIFEHLDWYSLYCAGKVCTKWRDLLQRSKKFQRIFERTFDELWTHQFRDIYPVMDYEVFSKLLDSVNCNPCFLQEPERETPIDKNIPASLGIRRLMKERREFPSVCEGVFAYPKTITKFIARIPGPPDSPYENGIFYLSVNIKNTRYPLGPPDVRFLTKIFHPAISCHGHISLDLFGVDWSPAYGILKVLVSIQSFLTDNNFELCEHTPIGKLYKENKPEYERIARIWTEKFAMQHLIHPVSMVQVPVVPAPVINN